MELDGHLGLLLSAAELAETRQKKAIGDSSEERDVGELKVSATELKDERKKQNARVSKKANAIDESLKARAITENPHLMQ